MMARGLSVRILISLGLREPPSHPSDYLNNVDLRFRADIRVQTSVHSRQQIFRDCPIHPTSCARQLNLYRHRGVTGASGGARPELTIGAPTATTWQSLYD